MKTRKKLLLALAALGLLLGGLVGFWWPSTRSMSMAELGMTQLPLPAVSSSPGVAPTSLPVTISTGTNTAPLHAVEAVTNDPSSENNSLRDTAVDGEISLNPDGSVRLNLELRRMFDYYLARAGELPGAQLIVWIEAQLDANYPPAVASQLKSLLAQYRNYLRVLNAETPRLEALTPRLRLQALAELRKRVLGLAMADAFFANEHAWDTFTQDRLELARDNSITAAVRAQREQELLQRLPRELAQSYAEQKALDSKLNVDLPAAESARFAVRERLFGSEAAGRFAALDQNQAAFEGRVRSYLDAREKQQALSDAARAQLRTQYFDANEAARVAALEAIGQESVLLGH